MGSVFRKGGSGSAGGAAEAAATQSAEIARRIEEETRGLRTTGIGFLEQAQEPGGALPAGLRFPRFFPQIDFGGGVFIGQPPTGFPQFGQPSRSVQFPQVEGRQVDFGRVLQRAQELQELGDPPPTGKAGILQAAFQDALRASIPQQAAGQQPDAAAVATDQPFPQQFMGGGQDIFIPPVPFGEQIPFPDIPIAGTLETQGQEAQALQEAVLAGGPRGGQLQEALVNAGLQRELADVRLRQQLGIARGQFETSEAQGARQFAQTQGLTAQDLAVKQALSKQQFGLQERMTGRDFLVSQQDREAQARAQFFMTALQTGFGAPPQAIQGLQGATAPLLQREQFRLQENQGARQGIGKALGSVLGAFCWIAEVLYGETARETYLLRAWLNGPFSERWMGRQVMRLYRWKGREVAKSLRRHPSMQRFIKPVFDLALFYAERWEGALWADS